VRVRVRVSVSDSVPVYSAVYIICSSPCYICVTYVTRAATGTRCYATQVFFTTRQVPG